MAIFTPSESPAGESRVGEVGAGGSAGGAAGDAEIAAGIGVTFSFGFGFVLDHSTRLLSGLIAISNE